jgi:mRNA-degrading endonuclease RelE of RelBE toxin-antitoxin system
MFYSKNSGSGSGFKVLIRPQVQSYLETMAIHAKKQASRCADALAELGQDPFRDRPGVDIKRWRGPEFQYRLRVGRHRFGYDVRKAEKIVDVKRAWMK